MEYGFLFHGIMFDNRAALKVTREAHRLDAIVNTVAFVALYTVTSHFSVEKKLHSMKMSS
jgi:hypothetical protein